jgi:transposase-like protein
MSKGKGLEELFDGRHFDREIIVLCVRWYLRYKLSLRDLVEMMAERGIVTLADRRRKSTEDAYLLRRLTDSG